MVVLDKAARDADFAQPLLVKDFAEPTTIIDVLLGNDQPRQIHQNGRDVRPLSLRVSKTPCGGSHWHLPIDAAILNDLDFTNDLFRLRQRRFRGELATNIYATKTAFTIAATGRDYIYRGITGTFSHVRCADCALRRPMRGVWRRISKAITAHSKGAGPPRAGHCASVL